MIGVFTSHYRTATRSAALSKPINCEAPHGSSEDRVSYARLQQACLTKYELGSNRCSRFDLSCNQDRYFRGFSLTARLVDRLATLSLSARTATLACQRNAEIRGAD